jgi:dienelactone hydrolase
VFFEGLPWQGKPTRVFAWYGVPAGKNGAKVPAMVLVHGGGGTAFAAWVKLWNSRGYAAIAMDTCGAVPEFGSGKTAYNPPRKRHEFSGPAGWGGFDQLDLPEKDQWSYHAVADVILAHSLLRSMPGVDPKRIGLTGISWGGYLTTIAGSLDDRFRFAAPVYGCGHLGEDSAWLAQFAKMGAAKAKRWLELWDPSSYLHHAKEPFLWVTGTNDFAYPFPSLQKSYRLPRGPRTLAIRVRMPHGHEPGVAPEEIHAFANSIINGQQPLARIQNQGRRGNDVWAAVRSAVPIQRAELNFTKDKGRWQDRKWETVAAKMDRRRVSATLPDGARVYYLNVFDERGMVVSSEHVVVA